MNRILQAEVILTLTRDEAGLLMAVVNGRLNESVPRGDVQTATELGPLLMVLDQQCAKQGVQL